MRRYQVLPHVADMRLRIEGTTPEELFAAALEGMNHILKKDFCAERDSLPERQEVKVSSYDMTALLVDFLSEVLTLSIINRAVFCRVEFTALTSNSLTATLSGAKVSGFDEDIKAASYHEAEIVRNSQGNYQTNVVFDV